MDQRPKTRDFEPPARARIGGLGRTGGFALLLTLTLLSFLVLLMVGLATYTRVETAIAGNMQRQGQARENALLGLNVALAKLQEFAGPDQRVTATARAFSEENIHYTGVWRSDGTDFATTPWLVSGLESGTTIDPTQALNANDTANETLVGRNSVGVGNTADFVIARKQDIAAPGVPGRTGATVIGRYAWWVGDQGVKAPVAVADTTEQITIPPYDTADARGRLRQQMAVGAGATGTSGGAPSFEPRDAENAPLVANQKVTALGQIAFLRDAVSSGTLLGLSRVRQNFHTWSPNNFAVLADSARGGLREDLSLVPQRLGGAFSAWARYDRPQAVAMEPITQPDYVVGTDPTPPMPAYGADPIRRRFFITPNPNGQGGGLEGGIHPVLSFFGISFSIRDGVAPNYEVSARCVIGLWNPHSSSFVPPAGSNNRLEIRVSELPDVRVQDSLGGRGVISLQKIMGNPTLNFTLAWPDEATREDEASWLPGRVYYWTAKSNAAEPPEGNLMVFNERNATFLGGDLVRPTNLAHRVGEPDVRVFRSCSVSDETTLRVQLVRVRDQAVIATFESPRFREFQTSEDELETNDRYVDFAFVFRLPDPMEIPEGETASWLNAPQRDPRRLFMPGSAYVAGENGPIPSAYGGRNVTGLTTRYLSRLLDRATDSHDYNEDVPVFELPRGPFLSIGALQHLLIPAARPFAIGNPWGSDVEVNGFAVNSLFDRFFFSGLMDGLTPGTSANGELLPPNPLVKPLRKADGAHVSFENIRDIVNPPNTTDVDGNVIPGGPGSGFSSKHFLQGSAFNLNSTSATAWVAVLRGVRFPSPQAFSYHDVSPQTGTAGDDLRATVQSDEAQFFRFSHSAQETYKADWASLNAEEGITPPRTDWYRKGMRTLTGAEVASLATRIVELVTRKHAAADGAGGPFRSVEEFLSPSGLFASVDAEGNAGAPRSLLEAAIADEGINNSVAEFSSQWLTQADIMTALAPILFARSDTFLVRTYGEAFNAATGALEGRAWCEALVQRGPEYVADPLNTPPETRPATFGLPSDPDDPTSMPTASNQLNQALGRRFKIISFRWLTRSDI